MLQATTKPAVIIDHVTTGRDARKEREAHGISVREMARHLGLSAPYISDLERGHRNWTEDKVAKWNHILSNVRDHRCSPEVGVITNRDTKL